MLRVVTAVPGTPLEDALVRRLTRADAGATVVRRCLDTVELRSVAGADLADVAVIDLALRGLDRDIVAELHRCGLRVVGTTPAPKAGMGFGADAVVDHDVDQVLSALRGGFRADPVPRADRAGGRLIAVWGPIGSPGRTSVAVNVADELARLKVNSLLADADTYGPSVAQQLGLLDDASGLAAVCRLAALDRINSAAIRQAAVVLPSGLSVLTGLPRPDRWEELLPAALDAAWSCARQQFALTVVDVGFCLEHDELAWFEPGTMTRNQATIETLGTADTVIAVCGADPVGVVRFLRSLPTLRALAPTAQVQVVVNRAPNGRGAHSELRDMLAAHAGETEPLLVPADGSGFADAMRSGQTLAEATPRSAARRSIQSLAERLAGVAHRRRGRRAA